METPNEWWDPRNIGAVLVGALIATTTWLKKRSRAPREVDKSSQHTNGTLLGQATQTFERTTNQWEKMLLIEQQRTARLENDIRTMREENRSREIQLENELQKVRDEAHEREMRYQRRIDSLEFKVAELTEELKRTKGEWDANKHIS